MKRIDYNKWLYSSYPEDIPRKIKKAIYGTKASKSKLRKEINKKSLKLCPRCRHKLFCENTGNMAAYPELWEYETCRYCGLVIGGADNSIGTDIIETAQYLVDNPNECGMEERPFKTLYEAVRYIGTDMKDYI